MIKGYDIGFLDVRWFDRTQWQSELSFKKNLAQLNETFDLSDPKGGCAKIGITIFLHFCIHTAKLKSKNLSVGWALLQISFQGLSINRQLQNITLPSHIECYRSTTWNLGKIVIVCFTNASSAERLFGNFNLLGKF